MVIRVNIVDLRPRLTALLAEVESEGQKIVIARYGKPVAALVSMPDLHRIWAEEDEEQLGPIDPESGRRRGPLVCVADLVKGAWR